MKQLCSFSGVQLNKKKKIIDKINVKIFIFYTQNSGAYRRNIS